MRSLVVQLLLYLGFFSVAWACYNARLLRSGGLSCYEKERILKLHNEMRSKVALGNQSTQPPAQNMLEMCWDDELAQQAQRWADNCISQHDKNRHVSRFNVGQNYYTRWVYPKLDDFGTAPDFDQAMHSWYNEIDQFGYSGSYRTETGHYSQIIWGNTYLVGCGYSCFVNGTKYTKLYVCNYGPTGNILGQPPYNAGYPACSRYGLASSKKYFGLCVHRECPSPCYYYY